MSCKLTPGVNIRISQLSIENFDPYGNRSFHDSDINTNRTTLHNHQSSLFNKMPAKVAGKKGEKKAGKAKAIADGKKKRREREGKAMPSTSTKC